MKAEAVNFMVEKIRKAAKIDQVLAWKECTKNQNLAD